MRPLAVLAYLFAFAGPTAAEPLPAGAKLWLGTTLYRTDAGGRGCTLSPDGKQIVRLVPPYKLQFLAAETGLETRSVTLKQMPVLPGYWLAYTPTGERLVLVGYQAVTVLDPQTGNVKGQLIRSNNNAAYRVLDSLTDGSVTATGDGKRIAFGTRYPQENQAFAYVLDSEKNEVVAELPVLQQQQVTAVLSPDGKRLATFGQHYANNNGETVASVVQVWDVAGKAELFKLKTAVPQVNAAAFSPDGQTLYTAGPGGPVEAWDVGTGRRRRQFVTRSNGGHKLFVSADGKRLAGASADGTVQVWDADAGTRLAVGSANSTVEAVALPPDGPAVAFGMRDQTMQLWKVPGKLLTPQTGHFGPVTAIHFPPDGKQIVTAGNDGRVVRWDAATGKELEAYGYTPPTGISARTSVVRMIGGVRRVRAVRSANGWSAYAGVFSPDGATVYVQNGSNGVAAVDLATGQEQFTLYFPGGRNAQGLARPALSADGTVLGAAGQSYDRQKYVFTAVAWDVKTGRTLAETRAEFDQNVRYVNSPATVVTPTGGYFGVLCNFQDQQSGKTGSEFLSFDLKTGTKAGTVLRETMHATPYLQAAPDERSAVALDQQNRILVYDLPTGKLTRTLAGFQNANTLVPTFHPTGRTFATATLDPTGRPVLRVVEWAAGETRFEIPLGGTAVSSVAYSPDGRSLAVGWQDSTVLLFDATGDTGPKPWEAKPTEPRELWTRLTGKSAASAWPAVRELTTRPDAALALIREHVKPVPAAARPTPEQVATWLADLDAPAFADREAAMKELKRVGRVVEPELKRTLETTASPETKDRIEKLLAYFLKPPVVDIVESRTIELLERIGTPAARAELAKFTTGDPQRLMTQDAANSLRRLSGAK